MCQRLAAQWWRSLLRSEAPPLSPGGRLRSLPGLDVPYLSLRSPARPRFRLRRGGLIVLFGGDELAAVDLALGFFAAVVEGQDDLDRLKAFLAHDVLGDDEAATVSRAKVPQGVDSELQRF